MLEEIELGFVTCVNDTDVLKQRLLASPCFRERKVPLTAFFNSTSAAQAFNTAAGAVSTPTATQWLVWVHEDVFLPGDWERAFAHQLQVAAKRWPKLAVAGVYGQVGSDSHSTPAGNVLDRGNLLNGVNQLPCLVDSLDELLFAMRLDSGLRLDPALKFDFYATDLVLQALDKGLNAAVLDAHCEHWSGTAQFGPQPENLSRRIKASAEMFEAKWTHRMPISTSCFTISRPGDVATYVDSLVVK